MKITVCSTAILAMLTLPGFAQNGPAPTTASYDAAQIRLLTHTASTRSDYLVLRDYYAGLATTQGLQAANEKRVWESMVRNPTHKYPSPVDSAHYLYDFYNKKAQDSASKADYYSQLAGANTLP